MGGAKRGVGGKDAVTRRYVVLLLLAGLALITLIILFARFGRSGSDDDDPFLDPIGNPNIRVGNA